MRRPAALALVPLLALALPAQAAPTSGPEEAAEVALSLATSSGRHELSLLVSRPAGGGPALLRLTITGPDGESRRLAGVLPQGALTTEGGVMTLQARVGVPLTVTWRENGGIGFSGGTHELTSDQRASGWVFAGRSTDGEVTIGDTRCGTPAFSAVGTAVSYETEAYSSPLSAGLGVPLAGLRCFGEWTEIPPA